ncbi:MAG: hypothetical protein WBV62_11070 [Roseobacter sp.]
MPSETASTLFLDTGQEGATGTDFKAGQFGGGFTWSEEFPLYLEGFLGWNRYDSVFIFSDGATQRKTEAKWNSCAASGAVGWDFKLRENLVLRPLDMVALGVVASDLTLGGLFLGDKLGKEVDFLKDGSLTAGDWAVRFLWPIISGGITIWTQMLRFDIHACTCGRSQGTRTL